MLPAVDPAPVTLLSIDPGRAKCGLAVVTCPNTDSKTQCRERVVVPTERLTLAVGEILQRWPDITRLLIGNATHSATLRRALADTFPEMPLTVVEEHGTSARARQRFVDENPAPGWRRLLLPGMRSPEISYDDYAALIIAEDFFKLFFEK